MHQDGQKQITRLAIGLQASLEVSSGIIPIHNTKTNGSDTWYLAGQPAGFGKTGPY